MSDVSPFPVINKINRLVQKNWPSTKKRAGKLYWWGHDGIFGMVSGMESARWVLDGQTPVDVQFVVKELERSGEDVTAIKNELDKHHVKTARAERRRQVLISSAKNKLTAAERRACFA